MMHGEINPDIFCRVIERIMSERDPNVEVKVKLIPRSEAKGRMAIRKEKTD
jgi:hypothetical protein